MRSHLWGARLRQWLPLLTLLLAIFLFFQLTIRDGVSWDDDAAQYISHARNIAEGRAYSDTGYVFNPQYAVLGPPSYPPGFPLLLAPVWAARGFDFNAMKSVGIICFTGSLGLIYGLYRKRLGSAAALLLIAAIGLCPAIWQQKEFIASDLPFLLFAYLALLAMDRLTLDTGPRIRDAILIACLIGAAYSVRGAGLALLPAAACYCGLRARKLPLYLLVTVVIAAGICGAEALWLHSIGASPSLFRIHPATVIRNLRIYGGLLQDFWSCGGHAIPALLANGLIGVCALIGISDRLSSRDRIGAAEIFAIFYTGMLLVYVPIATRFLFPLLPVYFAAALNGARMVAARLPVRAAMAAGCGALALVSVCYVCQYRQADWGPIRGVIGDEDFTGVVDFLGSQPADKEVVLFRKPRFLALLTGRKAVTYAFEPDLGSFVQTLRPGVIIAVAPTGDSIFASDAEFLWPFLRSHSASTQLIYTNPGYSVFRMHW